jgi:Holliday junction resolvase
MNETDLQNLIRLELSKRGFAVFRLNVGVFYTKDGRPLKSGLPVGTSDLMAVKDGRVFFVEVKVRPNKPTAAQVNFINKMRERGAVAGVVYSVDEAVALCLEL